MIGVDSSWQCVQLSVLARAIPLEAAVLSGLMDILPMLQQLPEARMVQYTEEMVSV